jgi:hypothetical protein
MTIKLNGVVNDPLFTINNYYTTGCAIYIEDFVVIVFAVNT